MENLSIDIETYSDVDLTKCGVYRYAESDAFEILLFAYSADEGSVTVIDMTQTANLPAWLENAIVDPKVKKWAYNATSSGCACLSGCWEKGDIWSRKAGTVTWFGPRL